MENKTKLEKIKPIYILENILSYIKDEKYKLLLFVYSKKYQKALDLSLYVYQYKFFEETGIKFKNYLSDFNHYFNSNDDCTKFINNFKKNNLKENLISDMNNIFQEKKLDDPNFKKYIIIYFKFIFNKAKLYDHNYLDIFSPFFLFII